ncbi:MAG: CvpA family protein [Chloroflexota bacterium]
MLADVAIILFLVLAVLVGVFRGAMRQFVALGAWLVGFVLAAYVRPPIADYLVAQEPDLSRPYAEMVAFVIAYVVLIGLAVIVIEIGGRTVQLTSRPMVDEVVGGVTMLFVGVFMVAGLLIALDTWFALPAEGPTAEIEALRSLNVELQRSTIADALRNTLDPAIKTLLGPLLPTDVRGPG